MNTQTINFSTFSDSAPHEARQRFVTQSQKSINEIGPKVIPENHNEWQIGILIGCLFVIALIRFTAKKSFGYLFQSIQTLSVRGQQITISEYMPVLSRAPLFVTTVVVYAVFAVVISQMFNVLPFYDEGYFQEDFFIYAGIIGGYIILKNIIIRGVGSVFKVNELSKYYISNNFSFNVIASVLLIPVLMVSVYDNSTTIIYVAITLSILLFIFRTIRGMFFSFEQQKYTWYHFFIYFCTLEILPVLIVIKTILIVNEL
ncbi:MAG: hypothetical protein B6I19_09925 [Bacteroidetes bacterium 4572_114]|nr:MAG: hypothetical protein B6I19_09925 [Bacteroidetes bacterium 4572_114]